MKEQVLGTLYVIAAPSGGGKTSLVNALVKRFSHLKISISYTTRPARPGELDGKDYHFIDKETFQTMVANKDFLEHAEVYGHDYGTSHHWVLKQLQKGEDIILEIDWQGARQIRQLFPTTVSIFILPPSRHVLLERLKSRKQDSEVIIAERMKVAVNEMAHCHEFDYLIVNDDFDKALGDIAHIVQAERLRCDWQRVIKADLLADLLENQ